MKTRLVLASCFVALGACQAYAEPMFLSKQYARCTTCHYSPTGGGLLTPYGRALSRQELSTTGKKRSPSQSSAGPSVEGAALYQQGLQARQARDYTRAAELFGAAASAFSTDTHHEEAPLWGILGDKLGPVQVGFEVRPLSFSFEEGSSAHEPLDLGVLAAYQANAWTVYAEGGSQPQSQGLKIDWREYWIGRQTDSGIGFRVGRFLPAYGIRFAEDAFTRSDLGFDEEDQVYGFEMSRASDRYLTQVSVSPGLADSIVHDDGRRAFTAAGRLQIDLSSRKVLVASGLYRNASRLDARNGAGGLAFGFAPASRISVWTEADARFEQGTGRGYILVNETAFEAYRGLWLKFSPQVRTVAGDMSTRMFGMRLGADLLLRTHWKVYLSYYREGDRLNNLEATTLRAQLHLYL